MVRLVHPRFPRYRLVLQTQTNPAADGFLKTEPKMTLEQRSVPGRWGPRATFSLSPKRRDAYATSLGDRAVEAAVNPERFVERLDPKFKFYSDEFQLQIAPHSAAIEPYQRTRRLVAATGGIPELRHERSLGRKGRTPARALAFDPRGGVMAVATDRSLDAVDIETWLVTSTCRSLLGWRAVDISPHGWIAAGIGSGARRDPR